jgi:hypothetical protein
LEGFIYSKKAFLGLFKSVHISRVITLKGCSLREVLLYIYAIYGDQYHISEL